MHELPVAQSILDIALRHARQAGAARITDLYLVIGDLASVVDDSIQFYWDTISAGTAAEGATLHFKRIRAEMQCMECFEKYHPGKDDLLCPKCGSVGVKILAGEEFYLDSIEVDTEPGE
ncbi:MAG: hydrogenase maturation nickel metallochaperone HypA [Anaerolineales bacterium]|nr:hydrogenase maturation nickel metallochaperone HypA [Anaerolineales bacterium]